MKKIVVPAIAIALFLGSCLPSSSTQIPAPTVDLELTAAVLVQQTLNALPTITTAPTNTPVVVVESPTVAPSHTATAQTPPAASSTHESLATVTATSLSQVPTTASMTSMPTISNAGATETLHARFYGTLPPNLAYNGIELLNKSKAEAYISLQVTTKDGYTTILEYPVGGLFAIQAPIGKYKYVAWVGGNKMIGSFVLDNGNDLRITIYKDRIEIKKR